MTARSASAQASGSLERKNRQQAVAHEFQDLAAVLLDRLGHRVEVVVEQGDHVVARPKLGDRRETAQIVDHDDGADRHAAAPPRRAGQDLLAGMRPDIGFEKGAGEPVVQPDFGHQREGWQQVGEQADVVGPKSRPARSAAKLSTCRCPRVNCRGQIT